MLILTRRRNEETVIRTPDGIEISVFVVSLNGDKVKLGFEAPKAVSVHRREVQDRVDREMQESDTREAR